MVVIYLLCNPTLGLCMRRPAADMLLSLKLWKRKWVSCPQEWHMHGISQWESHVCLEWVPPFPQFLFSTVILMLLISLWVFHLWTLGSCFLSVHIVLVVLPPWWLRHSSKRVPIATLKCPILCLSKAHNAKCHVCQCFMLKVRSDEVSQLKAILWERALSSSFLTNQTLPECQPRVPGQGPRLFCQFQRHQLWGEHLLLVKCPRGFYQVRGGSNCLPRHS